MDYVIAKKDEKQMSISTMNNFLYRCGSDMHTESPENKDFDDWEGKYPCGQQNCWVTCHCGEIME